MSLIHFHIGSRSKTHTQKFCVSATRQFVVLPTDAVWRTHNRSLSEEMPAMCDHAVDGSEKGDTTIDDIIAQDRRFTKQKED
uniref:Uncharacterized protein n=1 Tax=Trichogramma kaykai TaxID=54128 RepID=A0ABD2X626_9HYME